MGKKILVVITGLVCLGILIVATNLASGMMYKARVEKAYAKLRIGMTKNEFENIFRGVKFLKEQKISCYPNFTESMMKSSLTTNQLYGDLCPKNIFEHVTFDGNVKVFSYFIERQSSWPNGWLTHYVCIFYSEKDNKIIGWGKTASMANPSIWRERF